MTEDNEISDLVDRSKIRVVKGRAVDDYLKEFSRWARQPLTLSQSKFLSRQFVKRGAVVKNPLPDYYSFRSTPKGIIHKLETEVKFTPSGADTPQTLRFREETGKRGTRYRNLETNRYAKKPSWIP